MTQSATPCTGPKLTAYRGEIRAHLDAVYALCEAHKINWFAFFALDADGETTATAVSAVTVNDEDDEVGRRYVTACHDEVTPPPAEDSLVEHFLRDLVGPPRAFKPHGGLN